MDIQLTQFLWHCQKVLPTIYDDSLSYYEVLNKISKKLNECIENFNEQGEVLEKFMEWVYRDVVTKEQMENDYKLSSNGDFTGTINGLPSETVGNNKDLIEWILTQLHAGISGVSIDGGWFENEEIQDDYNGGTF